MKFCKNLQRMIQLFDPSWSPYWINYKMLKKLIKVLPLLETEYDTLLQCRHTFAVVFGEDNKDNDNDNEQEVDDGKQQQQQQQHQQQEGPSKDDKGPIQDENVPGVFAFDNKHDDEHNDEHNAVVSLAMSPREVAFFKLLHSELRKATRFFERIEQELIIREERIRDGITIVRDKSVSMIRSPKWLVIAKSVHRLYRDLLTLETYAVMSYCSFSKILKKHDKVTGYPTRVAYMTNFVEKANFSTYPKLLQMFQRCRGMNVEISNHIQHRIVTNDLTNEQRLFVHFFTSVQQQKQQQQQEQQLSSTSTSTEANIITSQMQTTTATSEQQQQQQQQQIIRKPAAAADATTHPLPSASCHEKENDKTTARGTKREQQQQRNDNAHNEEENENDDNEYNDRKVPPAIVLPPKKRKRY